MQRTRTGSALCALLLGLGLMACGGGTEVDDNSARTAEWQAIQDQHTTLQAKRQELAALEAGGDAADALDADADADAVESEGAAADPAALRKEVDELTGQLNERLVAFINSDPPVQGEPLTETQLAAIRMKSSEDMVMASEYIVRGGDYRRAMRIYEDALIVDPDNADLKQALADAESMRFMTEERFAQVKKGMTRDQVRELLGPVNLRNIRDFEDEGVVAWFYPKDERGAAAAVWFRPVRGGELSVYKFEYDAVKTGGGGEEA